jgi:hypothetical protein
MALVLRRTALFVFIVLIWALIAAAVAHASPRETAPGRAGTPFLTLR